MKQKRKFELSLIGNALFISTYRGGLEHALTTVLRNYYFLIYVPRIVTFGSLEVLVSK